MMLFSLLLVSCASRTPSTGLTPDETQSMEAAVADLTAWMAGDRDPAPITDALQDQARLSAALGTWIHHADVAIAHGTDAAVPFIAQNELWAGVYFAVPAPSEAPDCCFTVHFPAMVDGEPMSWVTVAAGWGADAHTGLPNVQITDVGNQQLSLGDVLTDKPDTIQLQLPEPTPYPDALGDRVRALRALNDAGIQARWDRYNMMVVSFADMGATDSDDLLVYLIPGTTDPDAILVSGWQRLVFKEGQLYGPQLLGEAPLVYSREAITRQGRGEEPMILVLSNVSATPTEAHVFASLMYQTTLVVKTEQALWWVSGSTITAVRTYTDDARP